MVGGRIARGVGLEYCFVEVAYHQLFKAFIKLGGEPVRARGFG
jgi:hypothetical protein